MTFLNYPTAKVVTSLGPVSGPVSLAFTDGGHVAVHVDAHVNDDKPTVIYRGTEYLGMVHLWAEHDWNERPGDFSYVTKRANSQKAPATHYKAIVAAMRTAVLEYLAANPDTLRAAEYANAHNAYADAVKTVGELTAQLDDARAVRERCRAQMEANAPRD